ncbi:MAG TPA: GntR family transcriptional regulator [Rhizomicrobium sp.]|jgi:DNA-binding GntR family transcriptional regulator|nr:GntR family transcriptional regulator [Rhizomicrobium sp.]
MVSRRPKASRLQADLARRILRFLQEQEARPGHHLVELDLCRTFDVSRTPVRGALKLLAAEAIVTARPGRGYVLAKLPVAPAQEEPAGEDADDARLFQVLASARAKGAMADQFTQQEVMRRFSARPGSVMRVLRHLAELGVAERRPGNGWAFVPDPARILSESYAFRRALEPQILLQPGFKLDRAWAEKARGEHQTLRRKPWRAGDGISFHAVNADFHEQLAKSSGNRAMLRAVERHNQLRQFLIGQWDYPMEQVHSAIDDHLEILAALEAGYADKAAALMLHHLTQSASQSQKDEAA